MSKNFYYTNPPERVILTINGTAGSTHLVNFLDGSINYYGKQIKQSFTYVLLDNVGSGAVRVAFDMPAVDISSPTSGAKTLFSRDTLHIDGLVEQISIYFLSDSTVEIIALSDRQDIYTA